MAVAVALAVLAAAPAAAAAQEGGTKEAGGGAAPAELLAEADRVFGARDYERARGLYEGCAEAAAAASATSVRVEALAQVARCWSLVPDLPKAEEWLARAEALATPEEPRGWSRFLGVRGVLERESGERAAATETFEALYDYCMERGLERRAIDAAHHAAIAAPPAEQVAWAKRGIAAAEAIDATGWLAALWNNLGATYEDLERYEDAIAAYEEARVYHRRGDDPQRKLAADWALGHAHRLAGNLEEAADLLEGARDWAEKRYAAEAAADRAEWLGYCQQELGELAVAEGRREEGLELLRKARAKLVEAGIERWWPEGLEELDARIAEVAGE